MGRKDVFEYFQYPKSELFPPAARISLNPDGVLILLANMNATEDKEVNVAKAGTQERRGKSPKEALI